MARVFHRLLGLAFFVAWASLGVQVRVLVGSRGLLPARELLDVIARRGDVSFFDAPTLFRAGVSDASLLQGIAAGLFFSVLMLLGILPRLMSAASTILYLSYVVICRNFLSFQWDNLILECGALAVLLPTRRPAPWAHFLLRALLFKLYLESGIAKYQSHLGDWRDGSAMRYYYETAPIPTWVAWYLHHLPPAIHQLESWGALSFELGVPFLIFCGRRGRLVASAVFGGFQVINILTANYGFFSYLALVLQVTLLSDADVLSIGMAWRRATVRFPRRAIRRFRAVRRLMRVKGSRLLARVKGAPLPAFVKGSRLFAPMKGGRLLEAAHRWASGDDALTTAFLGRLALGLAATAAYLGISLNDALDAFAPSAEPRTGALSLASTVVAPFRIVNTYHLFGHITRERIEPTFETFDGSRWTAHDLNYKPGDPARAPPFVAPHQPRVDFLLWFYGLSYEQGTPLYVRNLVTKLCTDPSAVSTLFVQPLPAHPLAARIVFYRYHFTSSEERRATGAWWTRERLDGERMLECAR